MEYMKSLRQQKGLSVQELAELCGVSSNMIWNYESGRREPPLAVLCKIADALDVSLDMLVRGKEKDRPEGRPKEDYLARYEPLKTALKDAESAPKPVPPEVVKSLTESYGSWSRAARKAFWSRLLVKIIPQEDGTFRPYFDRSDNEQLLLSFIVKMSTN